MAAGDIGAIIDSLVFNAVTAGSSEIVHITGNLYAIVYVGATSIGHVCTVTIDNDGDLAAAIVDDSDLGGLIIQNASVIKVGDNVIAIAFKGVSNLPYVTTVGISNDGVIDDAPIDGWVVDGNATDFPKIINIQDDVYAVVYSGESSDGYIETYSISEAGYSSGAAIDTFEFDAVQGLSGSIIHVYGDVYAITYRGAGDAGKVITITISGAGEIGAAVIDTLQYSSSQGTYTFPIHIKNNIYAVVITSNANTGRVFTFTIENDGQIGAAIIDWISFDAGYGHRPRVVKISNPYYAIAYMGPDGDGWLKVVSIDDDGDIGAAAYDSFEFDDVYGATPDITHVKGSVYAIPYSADGAIGKLITLSIETALSRNPNTPLMMGIG